MKFKIRLATLGDIEKIVKIYSEWGKFKGILPDCLTIGDSYDDLIKFFDGTNDSRRYLLAENEGNEAIGVCYIDLIFLGYNNIRLGDMMVKEKYRKMGVGGALVDKVIDYAKENNVNKIWLWTQEELKDAIRLYEKKEFVFEGRQKNQFCNKDTLLYGLVAES
ncbi:MAG: GCN5-related N-acetyltransferase [Candidatus Woesebacteria bacterium GW2011_GWB1_39_10b]|uniref:GCN5-related N-acetyltransferase n=2 Tax=Candidatus Woeseibacteriota TaxID=1752722 RepID=A0A0G0QU66_9BACT|nr:MAG: GCN5-related N-acetyltransferase [Microgenomates group bacterium GW2011_GWC1_38_12]KKQ94488.1 MAG: GCN5-related N-acetyltransferase [Candidatus Woesebacteria bacterium GW2011_GWB1_39_10b]KKR13885.1 MAG: GCN5-related N-acetyltransferase [Candidatus Woesebacteria bacterium GW2011_GWA1_39_21b]